MPDDAVTPARRRVVIVGGGFGGVAAAQKLRGAPVDVTLIDRHNHHLFQPLLYQVASGLLTAGECAAPIRAMVREQPNVTTLMASVTDVDAEARQIVLDRGERIDYDTLIVACGAENSYFGHDEWSEVTYPLKTLADAIALRNRVLGAFEEAERAAEEAERQEWLTFVVVGGGPTGVEVAGQLAVIRRHHLRKDFRRFDSRQGQVILLDAGERVLPAFSEHTSARAARALAAIGVSVRDKARATAIDARGVTIQVGEQSEWIPARTVIWAAGVHTADIAATIAGATGAERDHAGRLMVNPDLTLPGHPEISIIGDAANVAGDDGKPLPGLATVAIQQAHHVGAAIRGGLPGASTRFRYLDKGALAVIGRGRAVCEVRGIKLSGPAAFAMYMGVHLYYLGGVKGRRITVLTTWLSAGLGSLQGRVMDGELASAEHGAEVHERAVAQ